MEENNTTVTESTTSMEGQDQDTATENAADTVSQEQEQTSEGSASEQTAKQSDSEVSAPESSESTAFLSVQFNHESRDLTQDEAVSFAQKGLLYDKISPVMNKVDYLAAQNDMSVADFVESLLNQADETYKNSLMDNFGEDQEVINGMLELYHVKQKSKYEKILDDRKKTEELEQEQKKVSLESRLAGEFGELKAEFPEIAEFKDLPPAVKKAAADGKDLLSAYLYHLHTENKKIAAAQETAAAAQKTTIGSAASGSALEENSISAMLKGLWG